MEAWLSHLEQHQLYMQRQLSGSDVDAEMIASMAVPKMAGKKDVGRLEYMKERMESLAKMKEGEPMLTMWSCFESVNIIALCACVVHHNLFLILPSCIITCTVVLYVVTCEFVVYHFLQTWPLCIRTWMPFKCMSWTMQLWLIILPRMEAQLLHLTLPRRRGLAVGVRKRTMRPKLS